MLSNRLASLVHEASDDAMLVDARQGRALVTDPARIHATMRRLANAGFVRFIDIAAWQTGPRNGTSPEYSLLLYVRAPEFDNAMLAVKWTWPPPVGDPKTMPVPPAEPAPAQPEPADGPEAPKVDPDLAALGVTAHALKPPEEVAWDEPANGDRRPPEPVASTSAELSKQKTYKYRPHPSFNNIWPAAGLCEREIFEMLGLAFDGNENLAPLLLDEQFPGFPLRRGFELDSPAGFAEGLLRERLEEGMLTAVEQAGTLPVGGPAVKQPVEEAPEDGTDQQTDTDNNAGADTDGSGGGAA